MAKRKTVFQPAPETAQFIEQAARSEASVLLWGETGTGKTVTAREIHRSSGRRDGPFIHVDCGTIPSNLLEAALFGVNKGAYTGATETRPGHAEAANGGTLFVDEIHVLTPELQTRLLRLADEGVIVRVGNTIPKHVDLRLICATNVDIASGLADGTFRADLIARMAVLVHRLPPVRERVRDLRRLCPIILNEMLDNSRGYDRLPALDDRILNALSAYSWPTNFRGLWNVFERAIAIADGQVPAPRHLEAALEAQRAIEQNLLDGDSTANNRSITRYRKRHDPATERKLIIDALRRSQGNRKGAARLLGMGRTTLWGRMKLYGIVDGEWRGE